MAALEESLSERLIQRRLDRMRLGQSACAIHYLISEPTEKVALVPLVEEEYDQALAHAAAMEAPDSSWGNQYTDRRNQHEILMRSLRDPDDLNKHIFSSTEELRKALDAVDINFLIDSYFELVEQVSPSIGQMSEEEIEDLKKVLLMIPWSELTGGQWYAVKRFLLTLSPEQLLGKLPGSFLINP